MNRIKAITLGAAMLMGTAFATSAHAVTLAPGPGPVLTNPQVEQVAKRKWYYDERRHGQRFRHRDRDHDFFFNGFWYAQPYWTMGYDDDFYDYDDGVALYADTDDGHVQACFARYRSYDPSTDTYMGYDGYRHPCRVGY